MFQKRKKSGGMHAKRDPEGARACNVDHRHICMPCACSPSIVQKFEGKKAASGGVKNIAFHHFLHTKPLLEITINQAAPPRENVENKSYTSMNAHFCSREHANTRKHRVHQNIEHLTTKLKYELIIIVRDFHRVSSPCSPALTLQCKRCGMVCLRAVGV